jgi:hypothetical protein
MHRDIDVIIIDTVLISSAYGWSPHPRAAAIYSPCACCSYYPGSIRFCANLCKRIHLRACQCVEVCTWHSKRLASHSRICLARTQPARLGSFLHWHDLPGRAGETPHHTGGRHHPGGPRAKILWKSTLGGELFHFGIKKQGWNRLKSGVNLLFH